MCLCAPSYAAGGALVPVLDVTRKPASLWVNTLREFTLNEVKSIFWVKRTRVLVKWIQNNTTVLTCYKTTVLVCRREALRSLPVSQLHRLQQNFSTFYEKRLTWRFKPEICKRVLKQQNVNVACFFIGWRNWSSWRKPCKHRENMQPPHTELQFYLLLWGKSASHWTPCSCSAAM